MLAFAGLRLAGHRVDSVDGWSIDLVRIFSAAASISLQCDLLIKCAVEQCNDFKAQMRAFSFPEYTSNYLHMNLVIVGCYLGTGSGCSRGGDGAA